MKRSRSRLATRESTRAMLGGGPRTAAEHRDLPEDVTGPQDVQRQPLAVSRADADLDRAGLEKEDPSVLLAFDEEGLPGRDRPPHPSPSQRIDQKVC